MNSRNYIVFTRTWWRQNKNYPNGLEPHLGRKTVIRRNLTKEEARQMCEEWNNSHTPGILSRKAEYTTN